MASTTYTESKEQFRDGDGDGEEEEDGEETLDPRVKGELDRLNSSTAEINRLEQDLEELQATFRQTLTESAYILKSQATFLGKCINQARPYYDAVRKAKQSQMETQKAALKYERACSAHQAAKKMLAIAEQKLVSTSKEHKVLDPTWQEMLNQAVLKVTESDKERALSEREHLETARTFSEAGSKVTELRTKLKSAISKSRPYFDLKMKYDQILEAHKKQVEITQEGLQEAKRKYSLALKNLEGISEEIHEMRRSRDSLDTILHEREEGVGAESPVGDLSRDGITPETDLPYKDLSGRSVLQNKAFYGLKIALVSATRNAQGSEVMGVDQVKSGMPVGERDGDPEGCSSFDEQQLDVASKEQELSEKVDSKSKSEIYQGENNSDRMCNTIVRVESNSGNSASPDSKTVTSQVERTVESSSSSLGDETEVIDDQSTVLPDEEPEKFIEGLINQKFMAGDKDSSTACVDEDSTLDQLDHSCEAVTQESAYSTDTLKQRSASDTENNNDLNAADTVSRICETNEACIKQETVTADTQQSVNSIISKNMPDGNGCESDSVLTRNTLGEEGQKSEISPSSDQE